uniref:F-box domain-containing protein n=1 Tax=Steinernema glaseri TaxID=37863 RepID=A0A1I8AUP9_9BILA
MRPVPQSTIICGSVIIDRFSDLRSSTFRISAEMSSSPSASALPNDFAHLSPDIMLDVLSNFIHTDELRRLYENLPYWKGTIRWLMDSVALGAYIDSKGYSTLRFDNEGEIVELQLTVEDLKKMGDLQSVKMSCASLLCESEDQDIFELHKRILASKYLNIVCISRINRMSLTQQNEMFNVILGNSNITELSLATDDGTSLSGEAEAFVTKMIKADRIASLYLCGDISFELQRESLK